MSNDRTYCLIPDCDEQPSPGDALCRTHQEQELPHVDWRRKRTRSRDMANTHDTEDTAWEYRAERLQPCDTMPVLEDDSEGTS